MSDEHGRAKEPESNISHTCDEHAPRPDPRYAGRPLPWFLGRIVKIGFPVNNPAHPNISHEHMWVNVDGVAGDRLRGRLDNDPFYAGGIQCGDEVVFGPWEVEAVYGE